MQKEKIKNKYFISAIIIFFLINMWRISGYYTICNGDDFGYIANAAYVAGYNWNPYTGLQTMYYGYGFSIIASICFRFGLNSVLVYRLLLMCVTLCQSISLIFFYITMVKYIKVDEKDAAIISFISSIGMLSPQCGIYFLSEVPYGVTYVIITCLLARCVYASERQKLLVSVVIGVVAGYSYAIHARFLISVVVIFVVTIWYRIVYKKNLINYIIMVPILIITTFFSLKGARWFQETLYYVGLGYTTNNDSINGNEAMARLGYLPDIVKYLLNFKNWGDIVMHFFSLVSTFYVVTGGFIIICLIVLFRNIKKTFVAKPNNNAALDILLLSGIMGFTLMNILIAINGAMYTNNVRFLIYFRYAMPYVCVLASATLIFYIRKSNTDISFASWAIFLVVTKLILIYYIQKSFDEYWIPYNTVEHLKGFFYNGEPYDEYFIKLFIIVAFLSFVIYLAYSKKRLRVLFVGLVLVNIVYCYSEDSYYQKVSRERYYQVDATEDFFDNNTTDLKTYFLQGRYSGNLRFALYDIDMTYLLNEDEFENIDFNESICLSDRNREYIIERVENIPKYQIILDEDEYIYTSNIEFFNKFKEKFVVKKMYEEE